MFITNDAFIYEIFLIPFLFNFFLQGHDNFGHSIPELLTTNNGTGTTTTTVSFPLTHNTPQTNSLTTTVTTTEMSSLPLHNRPILGRRTACGIDTFIIIGSK